MDLHMATEQAYKRGYEDGLRDSINHGRWLDDSIDGVWIRHKCSICDFSKIMENRTVHDWKYCPNCGALMDLK